MSNNTITCFSTADAVKASAYTSPRAWEQYCSQQKKNGLNPSLLALQYAKEQKWWKDYQQQQVAA